MSVEPNTQVKLLSGVPLNNQYDHQMTFQSKADQESYFLNRPSFSYIDFTYQRKERAVKVPQSYDDLYHCNYIMYQNSYYGTKWFYGFITRKEYINPNTTAVYFEIDPWQTWQFDFIFHDSFIERKHCKRWNADGTPVINTIDEGIDYGSEYVTEWMDQYKPYGEIFFLVVAAKQGMHETGSQDFRDKISSGLVGTPTPINYFVHPFYFYGGVPTIDGLAEIDTVPNWDLSDVTTLLNVLYSNTNAVNNIVSIYITDNVGAFYYNANPESIGLATTEIRTARITSDAGTDTADTFFVTEKSAFESTTKNYGDKYLGYRPVSESKLLMYPYTSLVMTDFRGNQTEYKNEYIDGDTLEILAKGSIGWSNYVSYGVKRYTAGGISDEHSDLLSNQTAVLNNTPNDVPIINDYLSAFMQGHKNSLTTQAQSAVLSSAAGLAGGMFAGAAGAALGLAASTGSSFMKIQALASKIKDIQNMPPQVVKMGDNTAYDYGNGYSGVYLIKKQITPEYQRKLEDYFMMYGYKVNEVQPIDFKTRESYDFIKTIGANITGDVPADDLSTIINMFDSGVTLWHTNNVGDYSVSNDEV